MATRKNKKEQAPKKQPAARRGPASRKPVGKAPPPKATKRGGARVKYQDGGDEPDFGGEIDQILTR
jgi:hypothetical protein